MIPAVRLYPSGGVIYRPARREELMRPQRAIKELMNGRHACVWLDDLHIVLDILRPSIELVVVQIPNPLGINWRWKEVSPNGTSE